MRGYEIYILNYSGVTSLTIAGGCYSTDHSAIGAAREFARGKPFEVWRDMDVIKPASLPQLSPAFSR